MAQYQSSLTGPEIDAALTDMAQHDSEAWAVGTRDGVAVTSLDITYHNNAEYYANNAMGAAARAEAAVPAGTSGAVFFDQAQTLTDSQKAQARSNIDAAEPDRLSGTAFCSRATGARYTAFFRCAVTGTAIIQILVAGVGRYDRGFPGLYFLNVLINSGVLTEVSGVALKASTTVPTFGYYLEDGYVYVGVYTPAGTANITATLLGYAPNGETHPKAQQFYQSATAPTGWTAITVS